MKTTMFYGATFLAFLFFYACSSDDTVEMKPDEEEQMQGEDPATVLAAERATSITTLTADGEKVWRISEAVLTNLNGTFDISDNFNTLDDEFIFKNVATPTGRATEFEGTLEWRPGYAFDITATSVADAQTEFYTSGDSASFDFQGESGSEVETLGGNLVISLSEDNPTAIWDLGDASSMQLTLTPKLAVDYQQVPSSTLTFSEAFSFSSNGIDGFSPGMIGSLADNSFYLATREGAFSDGFINPERVIRFNLTTGEINERLNFMSDFVSKELNIVDDRLYIAGGQRVNSYDLGLENDPIVSPDYSAALGLEFLGLSRFGTAVLGNDIYIVGGDLDDNFSDKIFKYNTQSQTMVEFATMPEPRTAARAEIVNNTLYIFGGTPQIFTPPAEDSIYIFDLDTAEFTEETMPVALDYSYTGKNENLIYVAGRIDVFDANFAAVDREPYLGVYDTTTGTFTELQTNLESPDRETIHAMAVFQDQIYILYGQFEEQAEGELQPWSVLAAGI